MNQPLVGQPLVGQPLLSVESVSKRYGGLAVLDEVTFATAPAERVGLIGPNGAGKTTLFNCVSGNERQDSGEIFFKGVPLSNATVARRAMMGIGRTFQHIQLFSDLSVEGNLLTAIRAARRSWSIARDLSNRAKLDPAEDRLIDDTLGLLNIRALRGSSALSLTLGQGRLVEVARALVSSPSLILLDEPASGLDIAESEDLAQALLEVNRSAGTALLVVEHDLRTVSRIAERVILLKEGRIVADGPTEEVIPIATA